MEDIRAEADTFLFEGRSMILQGVTYLKKTCILYTLLTVVYWHTPAVKTNQSNFFMRYGKLIFTNYDLKCDESKLLVYPHRKIYGKPANTIMHLVTFARKCT